MNQDPSIVRRIKVPKLDIEALSVRTCVLAYEANRWVIDSLDRWQALSQESIEAQTRLAFLALNIRKWHAIKALSEGLLGRERGDFGEYAFGLTRTLYESYLVGEYIFLNRNLASTTINENVERFRKSKAFENYSICQRMISVANPSTELKEPLKKVLRVSKSQIEELMNQFSIPPSDTFGSGLFTGKSLEDIHKMLRLESQLLAAPYLDAMQIAVHGMHAIIHISPAILDLSLNESNSDFILRRRSYCSQSLLFSSIMVLDSIKQSARFFGEELDFECVVEKAEMMPSSDCNDSNR